MRLKLDLHVHTRASHDSLTTLDEALREAVVKRLHGIALTEHGVPSKASGFVKGVLIIPGLEEQTTIGHVLVLGVNSWRLKPGMKPLEVVLEEAEKVGAVTVLAHPFPKTLLLPLISWVRELGVKALEVLNSGELFFRLSSKINIAVALRLKIPMTAGSDSHMPKTIGCAYTVVETPSTSLDDILDSIEQGRTEVYGKPSGLRIKMEGYVLKKRLQQSSRL